MQRLKVSGAVRHIYIYIYIYMSLGVKGVIDLQFSDNVNEPVWSTMNAACFLSNV
jgi:hypothetical protein